MLGTSKTFTEHPAQYYKPAHVEVNVADIVSSSYTDKHSEVYYHSDEERSSMVQYLAQISTILLNAFTL